MYFKFPLLTVSVCIETMSVTDSFKFNSDNHGDATEEADGKDPTLWIMLGIGLAKLLFLFLGTVIKKNRKIKKQKKEIEKLRGELFKYLVVETNNQEESLESPAG